MDCMTMDPSKTALNTEAKRKKKLEERQASVRLWVLQLQQVERNNQERKESSLAGEETDRVADLYNSVVGPQQLTPGRRSGPTNGMKQHAWLMWSLWLAPYVMWEAFGSTRPALYSALVGLCDVTRFFAARCVDVSIWADRDAFKRRVFEVASELEGILPLAERCITIHGITHLPDQVWLLACVGLCSFDGGVRMLFSRAHLSLWHARSVADLVVGTLLAPLDVPLRFFPRVGQAVCV
jgi:hypothetical protein